MKKDKLQDLVQGFIGNDAEKHPTRAQRRDLSEEEVKEYDVSPEMQAALNTIRRQKVGRPKGRKTGSTREPEARATFIIDPDLLRKVKYIAFAETRLFKHVINDIFSSYVEKWEEENGKIQLHKPKKYEIH